MAQKTLMLLEASGIQDYIFGSNELAQHIGASELVRLATEVWPEAELERYDAEVIYKGGGNMMLLFDDDAEAKRFAQSLSRRVLVDAPGLNLLVQRTAYTPGEQPLAKIHQALRQTLAARKGNHRPSVPLLGLGVTAECVYTGKPAVEVAPEDGRLIAAEVRAKRDMREAGNQQLLDQVPDVRKAGFDFVYNFDQVGTKGESSYLAVIHTDGNCMGQRIKDLGADYIDDDEAYVQALRDFSASVRKAADVALNSTVRLLLDNTKVDDRDGKLKVRGVVEVHDNHLPFRPIVFGGDDVTFVCDGRLGLAITAHYLRVFSEQVLSDKHFAHARAGVAVVKTHYPFSRAYELAEALAASAKRYIKDAKESELTAMDWHFAVSGLVEPLTDVREREYRDSAGSLLMRPVRLNPDTGDWRSWGNFVYIMQAFARDPWAERRNKIVALRDALRGGPDAVRHYLAIYPELSALPEIPDRPTMQEQGWQGGECGYFDAVEALDFFVLLEEGTGQ